MNNKIEAIYDYCDHDGTLLYQIVRFIPKRFQQRHYYQNKIVWGISTGEYYLGPDQTYHHKTSHDPKNTTYVKIPGIPYHVPFHLQRMLQCSLDPLYLVEGEKDVLSLEHFGYIATTNSGGVANFTKDLISYFKDRHVIIIADNDDAGKRGALHRASLLYPLVRSLKVIPQLPDVPLHGDITDYIHRHPHTFTAQFSHLIQSTPYWTPHTSSSTQHHSYIPRKTHNKITSIYDFLALFHDVRESSSHHWLAKCPYHDDKVHSMSITLKDKKILIYCFAGCKSSDILTHINLSWKDLYLS